MVLKGLGGNQPTLFVYLYPPRILIPTWMDIDLPTRGGLLLSSFSSRSGQEPVRLSGRASRSASVMLLNRILFTFFINSATDLVVAGSRSSLIDLTSSSSESAGMKGGSGNFLLVGYEKIWYSKRSTFQITSILYMGIKQPVTCRLLSHGIDFVLLGSTIHHLYHSVQTSLWLDDSLKPSWSLSLQINGEVVTQIVPKCRQSIFGQLLKYCWTRT